MPNSSISDPKVVALILNEIKVMPNAFLIDYTFDDYYNRLIVSVVGDRKR